jgi:hypothetical protein
MPQASERVVISLQPPKKKGVRARAYQFAVEVRSQTAAEAAIVHGQVDISPTMEVKARVHPYRITARRKGTFLVDLANVSLSDAGVVLDCTDLDEGLRFTTPEGSTMVTAWHSREVPVIAKPKRGWVLGEKKRYDISITATDSEGNTQTVNCELYHHPLLGTWRGVFRVIRIIIFVAIIGTLLGFVIHWGGGWNMLTRSPQSWWNELVRTVEGWFFR